MNQNLYRALGEFLEAFRYYTLSFAHTVPDFEQRIINALSESQLQQWQEGLKLGKTFKELLDFQHIKWIALKNKDLFRDDFGGEVNNLPAWLDEIIKARNKIAHYDRLTPDEESVAWIFMKKIARILKMDELEEKLNLLQANDASLAGAGRSGGLEGNAGKEEEGARLRNDAHPVSKKSGVPKGWRQLVRLPLDIQNGVLDESIFAASLSEVALGGGREMYCNPSHFFSKTYFTRGLQALVRRVIQGLNTVEGDKHTEEAGNRVISLQTGFGGGKTHLLITLYHIAKGGKRLSFLQEVEELYNASERPNFETARIGVFTHTTNDVANGRKVEDGITLRTLWGELAYQLGGASAYQIIRENDEQMIAPGGLFKQILSAHRPVLILIDELADYCVKASAKKVGKSVLSEQTISFMQELTEAVQQTPGCVLVVTLPASSLEVGAGEVAQQILSSLERRIGRVAADTQPIENEEIFAVIRKRLFEYAGSEQERQKVADYYFNFYSTYRESLPERARQPAYKQSLLQAYPFHPELIDVFRVRWASHPDFQRTRGVLRLLAAILAQAYSEPLQSTFEEEALLHSGDFDLGKLSALTAQLKRLYGNQYEAVLQADIIGENATAAFCDASDSDLTPNAVARRAATTLFLNSFGSEGAKRGLSLKELKLHLWRPSEAVNQLTEKALVGLEKNCHYLHYTQEENRRYWFHTRPNINNLVMQAEKNITPEEISGAIIAQLQALPLRVGLFQLFRAPSREIPEQKELSLILLPPDKFFTYQNGKLICPEETLKYAQSIATAKGLGSDRIYRNLLLFLGPDEFELSKLENKIRRLKAYEIIAQNYQDQLEPEAQKDLKRKKETASGEVAKALAETYRIALKYRAKAGPLMLVLPKEAHNLASLIENQLPQALRQEEWLLSAIGMLALEEYNLLPSQDNPKIRVKDLYETFIRYDDKPMITGTKIIVDSLSKLCREGELYLARFDGEKCEKIYYQTPVPELSIEQGGWYVISAAFAEAVEEAKRQEGTALAQASLSLNRSGGQNISANKSALAQGATLQASDAPNLPLQAVTISGKVALENYTQLFNSFIRPLAQAHNQVEIEIKIRGVSTPLSPIRKNDHLYQILKEGAAQLGLRLEEE